ncbi:MAG: GDP-L-fucose synthase [Armatimonadetes bacterium]|nr:GDP-L-fucose synthase [Armatimonadota bacterium]MBS1710292.1 GDP-L-fucose synthase [Armatimonadota bacterium]
MLEPDSLIYVAGHRGMVGSAVVREFRARGFDRILTARRERLDLRDQKATHEFLKETQPDVVVMAAARVGGILANSNYPAEFLYDNLAMTANVIEGAFAAGTERLLYLGSACIYPRDVPQPMREDALLTAPLEKTNEPYAIAKIAGLKLCESYRRQYGVTFHSAMPTNLYGTGDNYHPENSHVLPAMIRRFHEAKEAELPEVVIWGSGTPLREFLHTDDCARALLFLLEMEEPPGWVNIGSGIEISIRGLAEVVAGIVGFTGTIVQDGTKPDGTPRKLMDSSVLRGLGWKPEIDLETGIELAYREFLAELENGTVRSY